MVTVRLGKFGLRRLTGSGGVYSRGVMPVAKAARSIARYVLVAAIACIISLPTAEAQPSPPTAPARIPVPDAAKITLLIQTHMAALSHANLTGNYSVLHSLGSPHFQATNSINQLAANFTIFRTQGIDISPTILLPPLLHGPPLLEGADLLRVTGLYDTKPQRVVFELAFQAVNNAWRLAGIAVSTVASNQDVPGAQSVDQSNPAAPPAKAAGPRGPARSAR